MAPYTRREFSKMALLALPTTKLFSAMRLLGGSDSASAFAVVQIGLNVPYSFGNNAMNGDDVLKACVQHGVGAVELRSQPVEAFLGAPPGVARGGRGQIQRPGQRRRHWRAITPSS